MDTLRNKYMLLSLEALKDCSNVVNKYSEGTEKELLFKKLEHTMESYCDLDGKYENALKAMNEAKKALKTKREEENEYDTNDISFNKLYKQKLAELDKTFNPRNCAKFQTFIENLEKMQKEKIDDDVEVSEYVLNPIDPLTKRIMVNPVQSTKCGHTFEKSSIENLLKLKHKIRCPIPGCPHEINVNCLEPNVEMKQYLQKLVKCQQLGANSQPGPSSYV